MVNHYLWFSMVISGSSVNFRLWVIWLLPYHTKIKIFRSKFISGFSLIRKMITNWVKIKKVWSIDHYGKTLSVIITPIYMITHRDQNKGFSSKIVTVSPYQRFISTKILITRCEGEQDFQNYQNIASISTWWDLPSTIVDTQLIFSAIRNSL